MVKTKGEEQTCRDCGERFPTNELTNGLCIPCLYDNPEFKDNESEEKP